MYVPSSEGGLSPPVASECAPPPGTKVGRGGGGAFSHAGDELGSPNSDEWRKAWHFAYSVCETIGPPIVMARGASERQYIGAPMRMSPSAKAGQS